MVTKLCVGNYIYHHAKFYLNRFRGFGRFCACVISRHSAQSDSATFLVLEKGYSLDARTVFDAKYVKRRGSAQESVFWGLRNQNLLTGHVIRRMRIGRVRIFNANQWETL